MSDELVLEYLEKVKTENESLVKRNADLQSQVSSRRPIKLIDFSFFRYFWDCIYKSEGWSVFTCAMILGLSIYGCVVAWNVLVPEVPEPAKILSGHFYVQGNTYEKCYYVIQEYNNGEHMRNSPCLNDMEKAVELRNKLEQAYKVSHSNEHEDIRSLPDAEQVSE